VSLVAIKYHDVTVPMVSFRVPGQHSRHHGTKCILHGITDILRGTVTATKHVPVDATATAIENKTSVLYFLQKQNEVRYISFYFFHLVFFHLLCCLNLLVGLLLYYYFFTKKAQVLTATDSTKRASQLKSARVR